MPFTTTKFPDLLVFEPQVHGDSRGYFFESYSVNNDDLLGDATVVILFKEECD